MALSTSSYNTSNPKLRNINLHSITRSLISQNPPCGVHVRSSNLTPYCHISLPSYHEFLSLMHTPKKSTHTLALHSHHLSTRGVSSSSSSSYAICWMVVHAYATSPVKAKWSGPHQRRWEENESKFHSVTCYTNSIVSRIQVNTTKLRNITCTLDATGVIIQSLECSWSWSSCSVFSMTLTETNQVCNAVPGSYDRGEPAVSYKWTGWV